MAAKHRRKSRRGLAVWAILTLLLMIGSFFLGMKFARRGEGRIGKDILLVNETHTLSADYVPDDLVNLYQMRHSFRLASSDIYLARACYEPMQRMFAAAEAADMNGYVVTSGYRDYQRQEEIYATTEEGLAQKPGASEHQTGLAFDVTVQTEGGFENTPQYAWLCEHAHEYGFIQRYPPNSADETGISYEPWHYRYVGIEAATEIHTQGVTLERYLGKLN